MHGFNTHGSIEEQRVSGKTLESKGYSLVKECYIREKNVPRIIIGGIPLGTRRELVEVYEPIRGHVNNSGEVLYRRRVEHNTRA